jgi:hypothetical protein
MLNTHLYLTSTLRMSGAIPLFPLTYAFMAWAESNLPLPLTRHSPADEEENSSKCKKDT